VIPPYNPQPVQLSNPLPRELAPGVFWLGECLVNEFQDRRIHGYNSAFLVVGERHSAFIETGITGQNQTILAQLDALIARGVPEPRYLFVTHCEMSHSGGVGHLLARYPDATVHGEVSDLHLVYPQYADRQHFADPGDRFELGGRDIVVAESVFRDLVHSRWFFETTSRVLFVGDGFAYSHWHEDGACGRFAEEVPTLEIEQQMGLYAFAAFHWTQFVDLEPYISRLDQLLDELDVALIAPTHGLPIGDPEATMPQIRAGLRAMEQPREGIVELPE
jgi:flavorubredoxin